MDGSIKLGSGRPWEVINRTFTGFKKTGILIIMCPKEFYYP